MDEENIIGAEDIALDVEKEEKTGDKKKEEKIKLEELILKETAGIKIGESVSIMNNLDLVGMGDGQAKLMYGGLAVGIVQEGKIQYKSKEEEQMIKQMEEELAEKEVQEQQEKDTGEREEEKDIETIKDDNEEPEELEDDDPEPEEPENAKIENEGPDVKRDSSWIEIRNDREADECRTFIGMLKKEYPKLVQGTERLFFAPNPKDANDYNLYVMKNGKITGEIPLRQTEGRNPMQENVIQYGKDGENATTKKPIQMLKIGNSDNAPMVMIYNGTRTDTQIHIGSRSQGDDYQSHQISSSRSQNDINDAPDSVKEATSSNLGERVEGDFETKYYETLENLERQSLPDEINPAKDQNKICDAEVENFEDFKISFAKTLMEEYGITKECAAYVAVEVLENGKDFETTLEEAQEISNQIGEDEDKGRIMKGSRSNEETHSFLEKLNPRANELSDEIAPGRGDSRWN